MGGENAVVCELPQHLHMIRSRQIATYISALMALMVFGIVPMRPLLSRFKLLSAEAPYKQEYSNEYEYYPEQHLHHVSSSYVTGPADATQLTPLHAHTLDPGTSQPEAFVQLLPLVAKYRSSSAATSPAPQ